MGENLTGRQVYYVIQTVSKQIVSALAAASLLATPGAAFAQASGTRGGIELPSDINLLRNNDPNVRVATAVVNGQVITGTDVEQRLALITSASQTEFPEEELQRLRMQVLRNLIDETLQVQEAGAQEIVIDPAEVDQTYARVAAQNFGQDIAAMDQYLTSIGSSVGSLKRQIQGELAWQRLLQRNIQPFINVSEEEVNELLQRLEASRGTDEYRIGEIYLSATAENSQAVFDNAQRIMEQLQQGGSFVGYARQFSEASTAAVGGDLGWIRPGQLPSELSTAASQMQVGQLVGPIQIPGGFSILYLIDKRQVLMADPRDALLSLKQISIGFAPDVTEEAAAAQVDQFAAAVQSIRGCGDAERAAGEINAEVVTNDQIAVRSLPEQLQNILLQLQIGQTTPPFGSIDEGVRVLQLCGRDDPQAVGGPSFDELMAQLEDERINKRAQRYLRDLRNDAVIDYN
ncbi:peptidylprolyl isomerase [Altererythrobacter sp. MF3-039]